MAAIALGQTSDCSYPVLDLFTSVNGVLTNIYSLEYQVFDVTSGTPVQVFPATLGNRQAVDVDNDCPAGDRLGTGHYVAQWTVPNAEPIGTHRITWYIKLSVGGPEQVFSEEFEVLSVSVSPFGGYCMVQDLRDEGVPVSYTDQYLQKRIRLASSMIERFTGRFFEPRAMTLKVDGSGGRMLLLNQPIIAVSSIEFETSPFFPSILPIEAELLRVYNRHLTENLRDPDDRDNPKIALFYPSEGVVTSSLSSFSRLIFPEGHQNIIVTGVFGYTDYDGLNTMGVTPELIKHVCMLMTLRELPRLTDSGARSEIQNAPYLTGERTRDQSYSMSSRAGARSGAFTGDPEIDQILASFMRPPHIGAA